MSLAVFGVLVALVSLITSAAALKMSKAQARAAALHHISDEFSFAAQLIADRPAIRPLFYSDSIASMIDVAELTPEDFQVAALVAESLCDAFDTVHASDPFVRGPQSDGEFYGDFRERLFRESEFLRQFVLDRPLQYNEDLLALATRRASEAGQLGAADARHAQRSLRRTVRALRTGVARAIEPRGR